ncbi:MAG: putative ABC exporter domain-containing protein, partial [Ruminiclostridium sp.]|nr:putative ABC exporter domain-containing protein [Ruminiclostridium sp.]
MNSLFYLIRKQLKNIIRGLASKPLALVGYIFIGIMLLGSMIAVLFMPSGIIRHGSNELFSAIFTGLITVAVYFSFKQGADKGSSYFRFSDVNFIFTSPIKANKVLLYGFIKRIGTSALIVMFSIFQLPNIKNNFVLKDYGVWLILLTVLLYSLLSQIPGMVLYTFTSVSNKRRVMAKRVLDALVLLFAFGFLVQVLKKGNVAEAFVQYLNSSVFSAIPIVGQLRAIVAAAVYGIDSSFYYSIIILLVIIATFILILYKTDPDYYEDVLGATEQMEQRIKAKREGKGNGINNKTRKVKGEFLSSGSKAIFEKHLL